MQLNRTHLAILISLIGSGSLTYRSALAQDDAAGYRDTTRVESSGSNESAIRKALGLEATTSAATNSLDAQESRSPVGSPTVESAKTPQWDASALGLASSAPHRGVAPARDAMVGRADDATDETHVRWTLAIRSPATEPMTASRAASPAGLNPGTLIAIAHATPLAAPLSSPLAAPQATPALEGSRPTSDDAVNGRFEVDRPVIDEAVLVDRAQPSPVVTSSDSDPVDGHAASLLSMPGTVPRPRRRGDRPPHAVIADTPSANARRVNLRASPTLSLPPDRTERIKPFESHPHPGLAKRTDAPSRDPLISLLQVLDDRDVRTPYREPLTSTASNGESNETRIASHVFERIALEVERLAAAPATTPVAEEPSAVVDIVDTIAASEAGVEPATVVVRVVPRTSDDGAGERVGGGRFLPMHLLDVLDGDVIDPAGALPVQALLATSSAPVLDMRPVHALSPLPAMPAETRADTRADTASIAALRSFFDDRSAMRTGKTRVTSDEHLPETLVMDADEAPAEPMAFETLDFPPLFQESPSFTKLQVEPDVGRSTRVVEPLAFLAMAAPASGRPDLRPSISFDIFDPNLDPPASPARERHALAPASDGVRPVASSRAQSVDSNVAAVVRDREPASQTTVDEPRPNPLHGVLVALADSKLEELRGGFETDNGLKISFGIERAVYVNGNLVTTTSLNVADLSRLTAGQAQSMGIDRATLGIIQSGANNTFTPGQLSSGNVATVVQNTLNDQKIQGITQINATVNSLDLIRRSDVQSRIQSALTDSIRR